MNRAGPFFLEVVDCLPAVLRFNARIPNLPAALPDAPTPRPTGLSFAPPLHRTLAPEQDLKPAKTKTVGERTQVHVAEPVLAFLGAAAAAANYPPYPMTQLNYFKDLPEPAIEPVLHESTAAIEISVEANPFDCANLQSSYLRHDGLSVANR